MLICSGTMPTFEPVTTKQTNLALCSTIQTGFIDRRIAATRSGSGSSRPGINAAGAHPPRAGPARGSCHPQPSCPRTARGRSGTPCLQSPSSSESPCAAALRWFRAAAAEPRPSLGFGRWFGRCSALVIPSSSSRMIQGPSGVTEG